MSTNPDDDDVAAVKEEIMIDLLHFQKLTSFDDAGCHRSRPMHVPAFHIQEDLFTFLESKLQQFENDRN